MNIQKFITNHKQNKGKKLDLGKQNLGEGLAFGKQNSVLTAEPGLGRAKADLPQDSKIQENLAPAPETEITDLHEAQKTEKQSAYDKASEYFKADFNSSARKASEYFKQNINKPMIQLVNLDLNFAKIGTFMMFLRGVTSLFLPRPGKDGQQEDLPSNTPLSFLSDAFLKIRQVCQYSIHARPSHIARDADDISSDLVHNLEAVALGRKVYSLNTFIAPWLAPLKMFFPHSDDKIIGVPSRLLHSLDQVIGKITNLFWNIRRVSMGLIPYNGGVKNEALAEKQKSVRELVGYFNNRMFIQPWKRMMEAMQPESKRDLLHDTDWQDNLSKEKVSKLLADSVNSWVKNIFAFFNKQYKSFDADGNVVSREVGSQEPENHPLYVRSKILSQVLGLPAGFIGGFSNLFSIGLNVVGNFLDNKTLIKGSDYLTNLANSLMAMVYITGEIPANVNNYFKRKKFEGVSDTRQLFVAGVGAIGMLNRMKFAPIVGGLMQKVGLKPILDYFHNQFEQMFLGYFSFNRWLLHDDEKSKAEEVASAQELALASKHDTPYKKITLPLRAILGDPEVSYKADVGSFYRKFNLDNLGQAT